ncbi:hypothetical protein BDW59DRAFT_160525 [Aspergillus cavernicola]|uniref:Acyltransferase 3 domain-containing protein n=1 Tax=Aspergillus cavernicola TaxID=176166 RepID=A0ABR4II31_9EURO
MLETGFWSSPDREVVMDLNAPHLHVAFLDKIISPVLAVFAPSMSGSDMVSRLQMISFLLDVGPFFLIGLLEKCRQRYHYTAILYPFLFAVLAQATGIGKLAGVYFFIDLFWSPVTKFPTVESSRVPKSTVSAVFAAMLVVYYPATLGSYFAPTLERRVQFNALWQLFPILVVLVQVLLMAFPSNESTKTNPRPEIKSIRFAVVLLSGVAAIAFQYVRASTPNGVSMIDIFFPTDLDVPALSFETAVRRMLQYDQIFWVLTAYYWLLLSFRDLQLRGVQVSWMRVLGLLTVGTVGVGPGATFAVGWLFREDMIVECLEGVKRD